MPTGETTDRAETPNRFPWPPVLFAGALILAWSGDAVLPLRWAMPAALTMIGGAGVLAALALMGWAFWSFARERANIRPDRAATTVIATGPFALSRNPIYLSEAILLAALGLWHGALWYWFAVVLFVPAVTNLAIRREEAHMAARFGEAWADYAARVRRWL